MRQAAVVHSDVERARRLHAAYQFLLTLPSDANADTGTGIDGDDLQPTKTGTDADWAQGVEANMEIEAQERKQKETQHAD